MWIARTFAALLMISGSAYDVYGAQPSLRDIDIKPGAKVAFLGMSFVDNSTEGAYAGVRDDQTARIALLNEAIIKRFEDEGFVILDNAPIQEKIDSVQSPARCYGCDVRMAAEIGADYVVAGEVRKTSNLILGIVLLMHSVPDGAPIRAKFVEIRSNTDESWMRGINYIFKNHYFRGEE